MSESADDPSVAPTTGAASRPTPGATSVEAYEAGEKTVLHDAHNPLAWIESTRTVRIDEIT